MLPAKRLPLLESGQMLSLIIQRSAVVATPRVLHTLNVVMVTNWLQRALLQVLGPQLACMTSSRVMCSTTQRSTG